jgi:hypothetical protein
LRSLGYRTQHLSPNDSNVATISIGGKHISRVGANIEANTNQDNTSLHLAAIPTWVYSWPNANAAALPDRDREDDELDDRIDLSVKDIDIARCIHPSFLTSMH